MSDVKEQLRAAWSRAIPSVQPTERDLTAFALGVAAERERCAKVCEDNAPDAPSYFEIAERLRECAAEIRRANR